jgi:hypothetical protein
MTKACAQIVYKKVTRKIFETSSDEIRWRKMNDEGPNGFYSCPQIIRAIKSRI